jgi:glycosyltransferase involved in cell wall biosynthesis
VTPYVNRSLYLEADISYYRPTDLFLQHARQQQHNRTALQTELVEFRPDIVMVWGMWNLSQSLAYWAEQWMPGRVAYFISNFWPIDEDPHTAYWRLPTRKPMLAGVKRLLRVAALARLRVDGCPPPLQFEHAVCCSEYVRNALVNASKLPEHAGVIYGGTDPAPFVRHSRVHMNGADKVNRPLRLLYFGRLIHDKGVHTAIEALGILKRRGLVQDIHLTILGSGHPDYERHLHALVEQEGIGDFVEFVGKVAREEVPERLGCFDVYLFTSIWPEPMARSVMEAMAAGLLVIGTEVGGQVEMLSDGENSLTFTPDNAGELADRIALVAGDPLLRDRLAKAGQKLVLDKFTLERMVDDIEGYLNNMAETALPLASNGAR